MFDVFRFVLMLLKVFYCFLSNDIGYIGYRTVLVMFDHFSHIIWTQFLVFCNVLCGV